MSTDNRSEQLVRLSGSNTTSLKDPRYLHYKFLFQDIRDAIVTYAQGAVLDIGCGNKPYQHLFTKATRYIGCDIVQSSENNVDILCNVTEIPIGDNEYDTIFTTQVLEHVADHQKMLSEAYRIMKPGGKIILTAPFCWEHHEVPYDFFRFTKYGLAHIFEKAGFKIIKIKPNGGKWALLGQMTQNIIISSTRNKKGIIRKMFGLMHKLFFKYVINIHYSILEKIDKDEDFITLNFLVVAEKI